MDSGRVAGSIGEKNAVGITGKNLRGGRMSGENQHLAPCLLQFAKNIILYPAVKGSHPESGDIRQPIGESISCLSPVAPPVRLLARYAFYQIDPVESRICLDLVHQFAQVVGVGRDDSAHRPSEP